MTNLRIPLSIVIPAYNEEARLPKTLECLSQWTKKCQVFAVEVVVVDDGSTDRTRLIAESYRDHFESFQYHRTEHVGYMNAIILGLLSARRDYRVTLEADCPVHPAILEKWSQLLQSVDVIVGSRLLHSQGSTVTGKHWSRRIVSQTMSKLFQLLFRCRVRDPQIGFKLFRAEVIDSVLPKLRMGHDAIKASEILVKADALGFRILELPVQYVHDPDSRLVSRGNYRLVFTSTIALFRLWLQTYREYRNGFLPHCAVRFGFVARPFVRARS